MDLGLEHAGLKTSICFEEPACQLLGLGSRGAGRGGSGAGKGLGCRGRNGLRLKLGKYRSRFGVGGLRPGVGASS